MGLLQQLDLFGTKFDFKIFGQSMFYTWLGKVLTLMCLGVIAGMFLIFGRDFFYRLNPKVVFDPQRPKAYPQYNMTPTNFTLAWRLEDVDGHYYSIKNFLYPYFYQVSYVKNQTTKDMEFSSFIQFKTSVCNETLVTDPLFKNQKNLSEWFCIDFVNYNITFGGFWDGNFVDYFRFILNYCEDDDTSKNCTKHDELTNRINKGKGVYFSMMYTEYYFDPLDLDFPLKYQYINYFTKLNINMIKTDRLFFKLASAVDDQGYLLPSERNHSVFAYNNKYPEYDIRFNEDYGKKNVQTGMYGMIIYMGKEIDHYRRTFMKIQDLAALVGGSMGSILMVGQIITAIFNNYQSTISLVNLIFDFDDDAKTDFEISNHFKGLGMSSLEQMRNSYIRENVNDDHDQEDHIPQPSAHKGRRSSSFFVGGDFVPESFNVENKNVPEDNSSIDNDNVSNNIEEERKPQKNVFMAVHNEEVILSPKTNKDSQKEKENTNNNTSIYSKKKILGSPKKNIVTEGVELSVINKNNQDLSQTAILVKEESSELNNRVLNNRKNIIGKLAEKSPPPNANAGNKKKMMINFDFLNAEDKIPDKHNKTLERLDVEERKIFEKKEWFAIGWGLTCTSMFCKDKLSEKEQRKIKIYNFVTKYIEEKLDITYYMNLCATIQKLIILQYNSSQHASFNVLKKPNLYNQQELEMFDIDLNEKDQKDFKYIEEKVTDIEKINLIKYFVIKIKSKAMDTTDYRLFDYLEEHYKALILAEAKKD